MNIKEYPMNPSISFRETLQQIIDSMVKHRQKSPTHAGIHPVKCENAFGKRTW